MDNALQSFILLTITIVIGLILVAYFGGAFGIQSVNTVSEKEASCLAAGLQIKENYVVQYGRDNIIVVPYETQSYNEPIYIVAFPITSASQLEFVTPNGTFCPINYSTHACKANIEIYSTSNQIIYSGQICMYKTYFNTPQFLSVKTGESVMVWILACIDGKYYRIGYSEVS